MLLMGFDVKNIICAFLVAVCVPSFAEETAIQVVTGSADEICNLHKDQKICKDLVMSVASYTMYNVGFYTQNCLDESKVNPQDKKACANAKELIGYLKGLDQ